MSSMISDTKIEYSKEQLECAEKTGKYLPKYYGEAMPQVYNPIQQKAYSDCLNSKLNNPISQFARIPDQDKFRILAFAGFSIFGIIMLVSVAYKKFIQ